MGWRGLQGKAWRDVAGVAWSSGGAVLKPSPPLLLSRYTLNMPKRPRKLPRDPNARAYEIVRLATGEAKLPEEPKKNPAAVALGKLGGAKGGRARAASMSKKQRSASARKAALARWKAR